MDQRIGREALMDSVDQEHRLAPCPYVVENVQICSRRRTTIARGLVEKVRTGWGHRCAVSTREAAECRELERRCARINGHICGKSTVTV